MKNKKHKLEITVENEVKKLAIISIILLLFILLSSLALADSWTVDKPSHSTLYVDTLTSKIDASAVNIADSQGLFVTGDVTTLGKVGIGTTTPLSQLHINSSGGTNIIVEGGYTSSTFPYLQFKHKNPAQVIDNFDIELGRTSPNTLNFWSDALGNIMVINGSGSKRVGIATINPQNELDVSGAVAIGSYAGANTAPSNGLIVSGNVGIGTASPAYQLDVSGSNNPTIRAVSSTGNGGQLILESNSKSWAAYVQGNHLKLDAGGENKVTFQANGNVGIGTTNPVARFHLGTVAPSSAVDEELGGIYMDTGGIGLLLSAASTIGVGTLDFAKSRGTHASRTSVANGDQIMSIATRALGTVFTRTGSIQINVDGTVSGNNIPTRMTFSVRDAVTTDEIERMRITSVGNVGIGTTNPGYKLDVAGDAHATSFPTSSDIRLKKNISRITNTLEKLEKIHGVRFEWNDKYKQLGRATNGTQIGIIAQELEKEFPELVTTWGNESYRAVDYGRFSAVLLEAVKDLKKENEGLKEIVCIEHPNEEVCKNEK